MAEYLRILPHVVLERIGKSVDDLLEALMAKSHGGKDSRLKDPMMLHGG